MLSNLQVCFNAVMPLFLIMGLGYGVKCLGGIRVEDVPGLNKMAFRFFMPVMLFWNLYTSSIDQALQPKLLLFAVGLVFLGTGWRLPTALESAVHQVATMTSPFMLFLLGAFFRFSGLRRYRRDLIEVCLVRLFLMPALLLTAAFLIGIRGVGFAGLISVFASATAIASFTMTQQMGGDAELAGDIVVSTSALCIVTMFAWSVLFKALGAF